MVHVIRIRKRLNKLDGIFQCCVHHEPNGAEKIPLTPAQNECSPSTEVQIRSGLKLPFQYLSSSPHHRFFLERSNLHSESIRPTLNNGDSSLFFQNLEILRKPYLNPAYCLEKALSPTWLKVRVCSFGIR